MAAIKKWALQSTNGTPGGRQKLTPLQRVANESGLTRQSTPIKGKISRSSGQIKVYEDLPKIEVVATETQTDISAMNSDDCVCLCHDKKECPKENEELKETESTEALELMSGFEVPQKYWEVLAESRREALEDSLHENEMLHQLVNELKDENQKLEELASQADYFAKMLKTLTDDDTDETNEKHAESAESEEESSDSGKVSEVEAS